MTSTPSPRRRAIGIALAVGIVHFAATVMALRALLAGAAAGGGGSPALHALVAVLAFPTFYAPTAAIFGGRPHTGYWLAVLNAVLWAATVWAVLRWRARRRE